MTHTVFQTDTLASVYTDMCAHAHIFPCTDGKGVLIEMG